MFLTPVTTHPEWFPSVPIFQQVDPTFCLYSYFESEGGFETKKFYADWIENDDLQFLRWFDDWQVLYDWDTEKVMISQYSEGTEEIISLGWGEEKQNLTQPTFKGFETDSISLYFMGLNRARWETENVAVEIAKNFIDAFESVKPSKGQLELQLTY